MIFNFLNAFIHNGYIDSVDPKDVAEISILSGSTLIDLLSPSSRAKNNMILKSCDPLKCKMEYPIFFTGDVHMRSLCQGMAMFSS